MSVPPLRRLPRDADSLTGRGEQPRNTSDVASRASRPGGGAGVDLTSVDSPAARRSTSVDWDSRTAGAALRQAWADAERAADNLDQVAGARKALGNVQKLVEQLRDVSVVGLSRSLAPSERVTLQRQVDQTLGEIDSLAASTPLNARSMGLTSVATSWSTSARGPAGFPAIGSAALGITELDVRSPDESLGTMRLLDRALTRLGATAISLDGATARFERQLAQITCPSRTASGDPSLANSTAALTSAVRTAEQLRARPDDARSAQGLPPSGQIRSLLE